MIDFDDTLTGPFWRAAAEDRFALSWCESCDTSVWYPEPACPLCGGEVTWRQLNGRATLYAWTVVRMPVNPDLNPRYIPALVVPEEAPGARVVTRILGAEPETLRCDMPLTLEFTTITSRDGESYRAPVFTPKGGSGP